MAAPGTPCDALHACLSRAARTSVIHDALIVGGGPAGATVARTLARAGWAVLVVEKKKFPRRKVCGEFISATSLPLLHAGGIGPAFAATAGPEVRRVAMFVGNYRIAA